MRWARHGRRAGLWHAVLPHEQELDDQAEEVVVEVALVDLVQDQVRHRVDVGRVARQPLQQVADRHERDLGVSANASMNTPAKRQHEAIGSRYEPCEPWFQVRTGCAQTRARC